jgi:two-component system, OmpR family, response regulator
VTKQRLVIVEDDPDMLELLRTWAVEHGCDVRTSRSGHHALEIVTAFKPRVLLTDYILEDDVTGVDVIAGVRNLAIETKCVLITGVLHEALREALNRISGVLILAKPIDFGRLGQVVRSS